MCPSGKRVEGNRENPLGRGSSMGKGLQAWESRMCVGTQEVWEVVTEVHGGAGAPGGDPCWRGCSPGSVRVREGLSID